MSTSKIPLPFAHLITVLICIQASVSAGAQKIVWRNGTVLWKDGDSAVALLGARNWDVVPQSVSLQLPGKSVSELTPSIDKIRWFSMDDDIYVRIPIEWNDFVISTDVNEKRPATTNLSSPTVTIAFCRLVVQGGQFSLLHFDDGQHQRFVVYKGDPLVQSVQPANCISLGGTVDILDSVLKTRRLFAHQLVQLAETSVDKFSVAQQTATHARYKLEDLSQVILAMNGNTYAHFYGRHRAKNMVDVSFSTGWWKCYNGGPDENLNDTRFGPSQGLFGSVTYIGKNMMRHPNLSWQLSLGLITAKFSGIDKYQNYLSLRQFDVHIGAGGRYSFAHFASGMELFTSAVVGGGLFLYGPTTTVQPVSNYKYSYANDFIGVRSFVEPAVGCVLPHRQFELRVAYHLTSPGWDSYDNRIGMQSWGIACAYHFVRVVHQQGNVSNADD